MKSVRLAALLVLGSFAFIATAFSQINDKRFEFSTSASMVNVKGDGGDTETIFNIPMRLGFFVFKGLEIEPELNLTIPEESEDTGYFINMNLAYNFRASEGVYPFILAGGGYGNGMHLWGFVFDQGMGITALNLGAGIKILVGASAALRLEYRFSKLNGKEEKTSKYGYYSYSYTDEVDLIYHNALIGVSIFF
jgi:hypothetical protein